MADYIRDELSENRSSLIEVQKTLAVKSSDETLTSDQKEQITIITKATDALLTELSVENLADNITLPSIVKLTEEVSAVISQSKKLSPDQNNE